MIKPHERYQPKVDYPKHVIIVHHPSYIAIAKNLAAESPNLCHDECWEHASHYRQKFIYKGVPFVIDDARDNAKDTIRHELQNYFWGARNVLNIGAAGGVNPETAIGDLVVGERAIRDNGIDSNLASPDEEAISSPTVSKHLYDASYRLAGKGHTFHGDIWTVRNKYYTFDDLEMARADEKYNPQVVEMEMAAFCIMAGWINANYAEQMGELQIGNLFYISDKLPQSSSEKWIDPMLDMSQLVAFKTQALLSAINTLAEMTLCTTFQLYESEPHH